MVPVVIPRPTSMFAQPPFSLGMYAASSTIMYPPTQLYPTMRHLPPPPPGQALVQNLWKTAMPYSQTSSPPNVPLQPAKLSPHPHSSSSASVLSPSLMSRAVSSSPSPPSSPASTGGGEKMPFTIDAILSSKPRSPTSSQAGSPRVAFVNDRRLTPSPDSASQGAVMRSPVTQRSVHHCSANGPGGITASMKGGRDGPSGSCEPTVGVGRAQHQLSGKILLLTLSLQYSFKIFSLTSTVFFRIATTN